MAYWRDREKKKTTRDNVMALWVMNNCDTWAGTVSVSV
jgi:hypothetical protein